MLREVIALDATSGTSVLQQSPDCDCDYLERLGASASDCSTAEQDQQIIDTKAWAGFVNSQKIKRKAEPCQ